MRARLSLSASASRAAATSSALAERPARRAPRWPATSTVCSRRADVLEALLLRRSGSPPRPPITSGGDRIARENQAGADVAGGHDARLGARATDERAVQLPEAQRLLEADGPRVSRRRGRPVCRHGQIQNDRREHPDEPHQTPPLSVPDAESSTKDQKPLRRASSDRQGSPATDITRNSNLSRRRTESNGLTALGGISASSIVARCWVQTTRPTTTKASPDLEEG